MSSEKSEKKARSFDIDTLVAQAKQIAAERAGSSQNIESETSDTVNLKDDDDDDDDYGPALPPSTVVTQTHEVGGASSAERKELPEDDEESEDDEDDNEEWWLPLSRSVMFNHAPGKATSAVAVDTVGQRLCTGGNDYSVKYWDFASIDSSFNNCTHSFQPCGAHPIKRLAFNHSSEYLLVISGNCQAKVVNREAKKVLECKKGYPFIKDMANTDGHVANLNDGRWFPKSHDAFFTCANDGTIRFWELGNEKHTDVIKPRSMSGHRVIPTACTVDSNEMLLVAGCQDGSIQAWDMKRNNYATTSIYIKGAHANLMDMSSVEFAFDDVRLASRSCDGSLKLWDIRKAKDPVFAITDLNNDFSETNCAFSPNGRILFTGVSGDPRAGKGGHLAFFKSENGELIHNYQFADSKASVINSFWHQKLNQLFVTLSDGKVAILLGSKSLRGAMVTLAKPAKKVQEKEVVFAQRIITPFALPMFKEERQRSTGRQFELLRKDPSKTKRPELPLSGQGEGGRLQKGGASLHQYVIQQLEVRKPTYGDEHPREAILRHADAAVKDPKYVDSAYAKAQSEQKSATDQSSSKKPKMG